MNQEDEGLIAAAYHEAGHVVVAHFLERDTVEVTIKPPGMQRGTGRTIYGQWAARIDEIDWSGLLDDQLLRDIEILIIATSAGGYVEGIMTGKKLSKEACSDDWDTIAKITSRMFSDDIDAIAYVERLGHQTYNLIDSPGFLKAVEALAKALIARETLSGEQAASIIKDALSAWEKDFVTE